ncbi:MAG TPA: ATP-binding protein, partial [Elusimicrobiota bacterium]|nr:ATP-binding protein [Elusimicrobiota bacterium]
RAGFYPESIRHSVSTNRLRSFFAPVAGGFRIDKSIRELCVFARHDLAADPPFPHLDLISCRNVLIYLGTSLQRKALATFHYALKPRGFLVLGEAESIDVARDRFVEIDAKHRIFSGKPFKAADFAFSAARRAPASAVRANKRTESRPSVFRATPPPDPSREIDRLLQRFAPATIIVDDDFNILQFRGPVSRYLEPLSGKASLNLAKMAMEDLRLELMAAVERSKKTGDAVKKEGIDVQRDGRAAKVDVDVLPIKASSPSENSWAIVFSDAPSLAAAGAAEKHGRAPESRRVLQLKRELTESHETLQSLMERLEFANQELASTREEGSAHNEELSSLNEELETAKEELQSTNEELTTINDELNARNRELILAGEYSQAVVDTVREPLLVVEEDLRVSSANRSFYKTFGLPRSGGDFPFIHALAGGLWNIPKLRDVLESTLRSSQLRDAFEAELDIPGRGVRLFRLTARRIYSKDADAKRRVLLALDDITVQREFEKLEALRRRDELRREFVAHVSHQFRTPLSTIRSCAETLAKSGMKDAEMAKFGGLIERSAIRLARLLDDLLSLSVLETAPTSAHERIALAPFIRDFVGSLGPLLRERRLTLKARVGKGIEARADRPLLRQVLGTLCTNAIKYSRLGGRIDIGAHVRSGEVLVSIRDRGIGIPAEERSRLFEPFYRGERARAVDATGTGLGLSIARKIVEFFGGKIWIEKTGGSGSKFSFTLPRA